MPGYARPLKRGTISVPAILSPQQLVETWKANLRSTDPPTSSSPRRRRADGSSTSSPRPHGHASTADNDDDSRSRSGKGSVTKDSVSASNTSSVASTAGDVTPATGHEPRSRRPVSKSRERSSSRGFGFGESSRVSAVSATGNSVPTVSAGLLSSTGSTRALKAVGGGPHDGDGDGDGDGDSNAGPGRASRKLNEFVSLTQYSEGHPGNDSKSRPELLLLRPDTRSGYAVGSSVDSGAAVDGSGGSGGVPAGRLLSPQQHHSGSGVSTTKRRDTSAPRSRYSQKAISEERRQAMMDRRAPGNASAHALHRTGSAASVSQHASDPTTPGRSRSGGAAAAAAGRGIEEERRGVSRSRSRGAARGGGAAAAAAASAGDAWQHDDGGWQDYNPMAPVGGHGHTLQQQQQQQQQYQQQYASQYDGGVSRSMPLGADLLHHPGTTFTSPSGTGIANAYTFDLSSEQQALFAMQTQSLRMISVRTAPRGTTVTATNALPPQFQTRAGAAPAASSAAAAASSAAPPPPPPSSAAAAGLGGSHAQPALSHAQSLASQQQRLLQQAAAEAALADAMNVFPSLFVNTARDASDPSKPAALRPVQHGVFMKQPSTGQPLPSSSTSSVASITAASAVAAAFQQQQQQQQGSPSYLRHTSTRGRAGEVPAVLSPKAYAHSGNVNWTSDVVESKQGERSVSRTRRVSTDGKSSVASMTARQRRRSTTEDVNPPSASSAWHQQQQQQQQHPWQATSGGARSPMASPSGDSVAMGRWSTELFKVGMSAAVYGSPDTGLSERSPVSSDGGADPADFDLIFQSSSFAPRR